MAKSTQTHPNHQWLKDRLSERKLSQRGLARSMGLDAAAVSLMLQGKRVIPEAVGRLSMCKLKHGVKYIASPTRGYSKGRWNLDSPMAQLQDAELEWAVPVLLIQT